MCAKRVDSLKLAEVRSLLRLSHELHDAPPDPGARKRRLLQVLCRLLRADAGVCVVTRARPAAARARRPASSVVSVARWAVSEEDARALAARYRPPPAPRRASSPRQRRAPPPVDHYHAADHCVDAALPLAEGALYACVTLLRRPPGRRRFTDRDRALLNVFHGQCDWVYRPDLPMVSPDAAGLPPRQRQTLQFLLAGHSEKQIATHLDLSHNTVHHYVKALYRHFGVSTRSELLARWVRK